MPTSYFDQFYLIDPGNPPPAGTALNVQYLQAVDQNDNTFLSGYFNDTIDGSKITATWNGDTVTVNMNGANVTITGVTFYLADGRAVFTPSDGTTLSNATFVSSTYVTANTWMHVSQLGPPCFVPGTMIATAEGERPVETLKVGDMVVTLDHGLQPVRWIGTAEVAGDGDFAPVVFAPGAIGNSRRLRVSPQHRVLVRGWQAELHYGHPEVLVPARHLLNGSSVVQEAAERVTYYHLMFDRHEIILSDGAETESFFPGDQVLLNDRKTRAELLRLFPELTDPKSSRFCRTARPTVRRYEAAVLKLVA